MLTFSLRIMNQLVRGYLSPPTINASSKAIVVPFRCWPIDIDLFGHMNNASYLTTAELSRWNALPASGLLSRVTSSEGLLLLAVENKVRYFRSIPPLKKYNISTTLEVDDEDKWFYCRHTFTDANANANSNIPENEHVHGSESKNESNPYAVIDLKYVLKERSGKTIRPSAVIVESPDFYGKLVTKRTND